MSIKITGNYATDYTNTANKAEDANEDGVRTITVKLKTSTPGVTKTEEIKIGFSDVNEYSKYLQGKYSYMNTGITSMQGVPTTVSVSSEFLKKCMNDEEKATYLEENLAALPDCAAYAVSHSLGTLTSLNYQIDANGNITCISSSTNDPDGKIAKENAKRKANEKKEAEEKAAKRRAEKKAEEQKTAERRAKNMAQTENATDNFTISVTGADIKSVTESLITALSGASSFTGSVFDVKS